MLKNKKIFLGLIVAIVVAIVLIILYKYDIIYNPFLDTEPLVCERVYIETEDIKQVDRVTIYFSKKAKIKNGEVEHIFNVSSLYLNEYPDFGKEMDKIEENVYKINGKMDISLNHENLKKKEIKKVYEGYGYECK